MAKKPEGTPVALQIIDELNWFNYDRFCEFHTFLLAFDYLLAWYSNTT